MNGIPTGRRHVIVATGLLLLAAGCGRVGPDAEHADLRDRLLMTSTPSPQDTRTLSELMLALVGEPRGPGETPGADEPDGAGEPDASVDSANEAATESVDPADDQAAEPVAVPGIAPSGSVWVIGRIFAGDFEPWEPGSAAFLISELPAEGHGEGHDADNCPFCKRKAAKAPKGMVRFLDEQGHPLPIDARKLFGVEKNSVVLVQGDVSVGELNTLLIDAAKMHILR
ncbi:MAG: hypothetical protein EA381_13150 [Planctomycetaceae bacterium]|nr:MAG: hypothetical protein EA381_13150 [Planctomycetaceae bacterium]